MSASGAQAASTPTGSASDAPSLVDPGIGGDGTTARATFGIQPAATLAGKQQAGFVFGVSPGAAIFDQVAVVNYSSEPLTLSLYPEDATTGPDGKFSVGTRDQLLKDVGTWLVVGEPTTEVTVGPQTTDIGAGRVVLPLAIKVPTTAEPGDHAGAVIVSLTTLGQNPQGQNVQLEQRVAARVYIRVDGEIRPALTVTDLVTTYERSSVPWRPGRLTVQYKINNTGNIRMGVEPNVSVAGPFGLGSTSNTPEPITEILPRTSVDESVTFDSVWPLFRLGGSIQTRPTAAPQAEVPALDKIVNSFAIVVIPYEQLVVLVLLVGLTILLVRLRARRNRRGGGPPPSGRGGRGPDRPTQPAAKQDLSRVTTGPVLS